MLPSSIASWPLHRQKGFFVMTVDIVSIDSAGAVTTLPSPAAQGHLFSVQLSDHVVTVYIPKSSNYTWTMIGNYVSTVASSNQLTFILYEWEEAREPNETIKIIRQAWMKLHARKLPAHHFISSVFLRTLHTAPLPHSNLFCYTGGIEGAMIGRAGREHTLFQRTSSTWSSYTPPNEKIISLEPREICLLSAAATLQLRQIYKGQFQAEIVSHLNDHHSLLHLFQKNGIEEPFYVITPH
jgi:hypothetical protein